MRHEPTATYDLVQEETTNAMQRVVNELPPGFTKEKKSREPYACEVGGVLYTGYWDLETTEPFDGEQFVADLPGLVGDDLQVNNGGLPASNTLISLVAPSYGNTVMNVSTGVVDGKAGISITALSRCAQDPES